MRVTGAAAVLVTCILAVTGAPASALSPTAPRDAVSFDLPTTSQRAILEAGRLHVLVDVFQTQDVTVAGFIRSPGRRPKRLTRSRTVHVTNGVHNVGLRLTAKGRKRLKGCSSQGLKVKGASSLGRHASVAASLIVDTSACGGGSGSGGGAGGPGPPGPDLSDEPPGGTSPPVPTPNAGRCDFLDGAVCLQPWPNDYFTVADPSTDTGRRLNLNSQSMPANKAGTHIDPIDMNRADGFSPGNMVITKIPGLDNPTAFANTGAVPITDMARYADPDQPVVVINADTGQRQPIFSELDANPSNPADVNLIIRPTVNWSEGGHYIVALRNLKDANGDTIEPSQAFKVYRDGLTMTTPQPEVEARRPHMEDLFHTLQSDGIKRRSLYLAWDFTVASEHSLAHRALSIRDRAFDQLGDTNLSDLQVQGNSPSFSITSSTDLPPCGGDGCAGGAPPLNPPGGKELCDALSTVSELFPLIPPGLCASLPGSTPSESDTIARRVEGTMTVPCYLNVTGCPTGSMFNLDGSDNPTQNGTASVRFVCDIPRAAFSDGNAATGTAVPSRPSLYGHGLLGSMNEVHAGNIGAMANEHDFTFCATDWAGFATQDIPTILLALQDLSNFQKIMDRVQQGFLNFMYLGRAMIHTSGFEANAAFQDSSGHSLIDTTRLFYDGNSQGGIMGGGLTALAPDFNRAVLGVPAMNYSTLLQRSSDFAPYAEGKLLGAINDALAGIDTPFGLYDNYPNELERPLIFSIIQLLWDRGEADGYAHHMTADPYPNTPAHTVLMDLAFGDHQVANVAAETEARTIGARIRTPVLDPGRGTIDDAFGLNPITSYPYDGSAIVLWDGGPKSSPGGTDPAPITDTPPGSAQGGDPHSYPRSDIKARAQKSEFLAVDGTLRDPCTTTNNFASPPLPIAFTGTAIPCYSHGYTGP